MSNRLLSLLTEIERALMANDAAPDGGSWDTMRLINYHQGLARLTLAVKSPDHVTKTRGSILLQNFTLADGSQCLKANLSWAEAENTTVYAIYAKPQINWALEASQIAIKWLDGQPVALEASAPGGAHADGSLLEAAG
jgi:hypothetical protein